MNPIKFSMQRLACNGAAQKKEQALNNLNRFKDNGTDEIVVTLTTKYGEHEAGDMVVVSAREFPDATILMAETSTGCFFHEPSEAILRLSENVSIRGIVHFVDDE